MDKLMLCISVMLIFGKLIIGIAAEEHPENKLAIFYLNDVSFPESFGNFTQIKHLKLIDANYLYENLSVGYLSLTESFEDDMKTFCHILSKVKVVALHFPHKLRNSVIFFLAGQRLGVPTLHVESTAENNQKNMKVNLIPAPEDSVPTTIKILQKYSWISVAVIYNRLCENCETKMRALLDHDKLTTDIAESIQFFQIISGMPMLQRTRQVAEVFAKIKLSTINKLVVYANNEDIDELLAIGDMMQLTGAEYTWIFPWRIETSTMQTLPVNTMILRPKNARKTEHFLIDGFEVVIRGFRKYRQEHTKWSAHSADCFDPTSYSFGEEFYRHIVQESFVGRTGNVEFDERGNRINADYELVNMADGKILWPENDVLKATLTSDNKKRKLRAVTTLTEPFASINQIASNNSACGTGLPCKHFSLSENKTTQFCCDGLAIELLHMLEIDLSIDVELHISKDGKYGAFDIETKQWNGMIGELVSNEVDLAVADLTITDDRSRVVDFAHPFMEVGKGVLVRVERKGITKGVWGFLKPVAAQLWITAVCAIFMMGILFWSMEKIAFWIFDRFSAGKDDKKREFRRLASARFSFGASLHYSWSTVVRTRDKITPPSNSSAKIGAIGLALCFLVFITTYTAQLAALLVAEEHVSSLTGGIKDTKLQNPSEDLKVAAVSEGSTERFFRTSSEPLYSNIWKHMKDNNVPTIEIGIERLKKREIDVFFGDYSILVYHAANDKDCALQVVGEPFYKAAFGIALQKNSSWTSAVSQKILEYEKYDVFLTLTHRWLKNSCDQTVKDSNNFYRMLSLDLSGVFLMVVGGIFISLVLLATEFLFLRKRKRQGQITIKDCQAVSTAMPRLSTCSSSKDVKM